MIIGDDDSIKEIESYLKEKAREWYNEGKKEYDADVIIIDLDVSTEFHLG